MTTDLHCIMTQLSCSCRIIQEQMRITGSEKRPWWRRCAFLTLLCIRGLQRGCYQRMTLPPSAGIPLSQPTESTPAPSACLLQLHLGLRSTTRHVTYSSSCYLDMRKKSWSNVLTYKCQSNWKNISTISSRSKWI